MTYCFPHGKLRGLLLPLKLTVILIILITFNASALALGTSNTLAIDAQQQIVTGKVLDANTNEPLIGVNVSIVTVLLTSVPITVGVISRQQLLHGVFQKRVS